MKRITTRFFQKRSILPRPFFYAHSAMKTISILLLSTLLIACAQGPDSSSEIASQGLFSGTFSKDGQNVLIGSQLHGASYWRVSPLERTYNWNHQQGEFTQITANAISTDGARAATAQKNQWILWNTETGASLAFLQTPSDILSIALNKDGSRALLGLESGDIWYTNPLTGNNVQEFKQSEAIRTVAINHDATIALTGSDDYSATFWDLQSGKALHTENLENMSRHVSFSASGKKAFISSLRNDHLIINTHDFSTLSSIQERYTIFNGAHFSPDENQVYLANQQGYIQVFDTSTGKESSRYKAKRKKWFGASRSIIALWADSTTLKALTSDGQLQSFSITP